MTRPPLYYGDYLQVDRLLSLQVPESAKHGPPVHDEMLFIIVHQAYELWFKQTLHEFDRIERDFSTNPVNDEAMARIVHSLARIHEILKLLVAQLDVLETMTPTQFTRFRDWLGTSSGFESAQFRELEAVLGRRHRMMVAQYDQGSAERERITAAMSRPSLFDSFVRYLAGQGYDVPAEILRRDVTAPSEASDAMQQVLKKVYDDDTDATAVCELLVDALVNIGALAQSLKIIVTLAIVALAGLVFIVRWIVWHAASITLTDQRVILQQGVFSRSTKVIPIDRVQDCSTRQSLFAPSSSRAACSSSTSS